MFRSKLAALGGIVTSAWPLLIPVIIFGLMAWGFHTEARQWPQEEQAIREHRSVGDCQYTTDTVRKVWLEGDATYLVALESAGTVHKINRETYAQLTPGVAVGVVSCPPTALGGENITVFRLTETPPATP